MKPLSAALLCVAAASALHARQIFHDRTHQSKVFGEPRNYRIFLPPDYESSGKSYPVIYYFHGHSDRYTLEHYDNGTDTVPKIAAFVAEHPVIVVSVDGYVARDYTGFYGGSPWDVRVDGGEYDFGPYYLELVEHIDGTYRTLTDRRHRATSGLSMGGFMSLYLSARYPGRIGSASSFNPGPEFYVGEKGRRSLWRPKDHVRSHAQTMLRLIRASGDYISQYHEETREAYARAQEVDFEYRQDEHHKHAATSIGETFAFHARAFENPTLNNMPPVWSYSSAWRNFEVWGCRVEAALDSRGVIYLEGVRQGGFRVRTRLWAPDGPPVKDSRITIATAPVYSAGKTYRVIDRNLSTGETEVKSAAADASGRIRIAVDGAGHQIGFVGPGTGAQPPVLLPAAAGDSVRVPPGEEVALPIRIYNPRGEAMTGLKVAVSSAYPTVALEGKTVTIESLEPGQSADLSAQLRARFVSGAGYFAPARLRVSITYDGWHNIAEDIDLLVIPEVIPEPAAIEVLDGRTRTFPVFRQKGNQGGGSSVERTVTEGKGNGNGILEPGEEATVWIKMRQGMDPFDKNNWYRAKVYSDSPWLAEVDDIQEQKQLEWTSAKERTSVVRLSPDTPPETAIPLLLDNESWTYHYTPDVRYGKEKLYQAFQRHTHHLHRLNVVAGQTEPRP
ncbi:MAG: alpha/beta hydrolase-fold protein [Bryobacteraceae bacterium]